MDQVSDRYLIEDQIGKGSYAAVYKGRDIRTNRPVAIKVLHGTRTNDDHSWARILAEGRAAAALDHVNICRLYDIGEEQDIDYVVLELIEGQTLKTMLKAGPLPVSIALWNAIQVSRALAHAHSIGIVHRDLTASNVMVTASGEVKVIDFGLARMVDDDAMREARKSHSSMEEAGWVGGTLPYMSPEVLHGEEATAQSDVWSLGVLLYEMLMGSLPFEGRTLFEVSTAIMVGKVVPLNADIPRGVRGIVYRCLERQKPARYQSACMLSRDLQAELASLGGTIDASNYNLLSKAPARSGLLGLFLSWLAALTSNRFFLN